jgi:hypoxanthine phosphoribosyltransferase
MKPSNLVDKETRVTVHDKQFKLYIPESEISAAVDKIASQIEEEYHHLKPVLLPVLNGSFIFAADLVRRLSINFELAFIKAQSYDALLSTGEITERIGLELDITDRHILLLEDIVDTGNTMAWMVKKLKEKNAASVEISTLLFKPEAFLHSYQIKYIGLEIPDKFVIGYGLDYDGYGRQYKDIYQVC